MQDSPASVFRDIERRAVEWPSLALAVATYVILTISCLAYFLTPIYVAPLWILINAICTYLSFTIVHEASHRNLVRRYLAINNAFGFISTMIMHGSFRQFVLLHHQHHAYTNDPENDPDHAVSGKFTPQHYLRFSFVLVNYVKFFKRKRLGHLRGFKNNFYLYFPYMLAAFVYVTALVTHNLHHVILLWTIPTLLGTAFTILIFDYLPHHPHSRRGAYDHSRNFTGNRVWTWLTSQHAYHIIHHLAPSIAWHDYEKVWNKKRDQLIDNGAIEIKVDWMTLSQRAQERFEQIRSRFGY